MLAAVVLPAASPAAGPPAEQEGDKTQEPGQAWFFKLAGPVAEVEPQSGAFLAFIKSIHFVDGKPQYDVPEGWKAQGASSMRYETFEIPSAADKPLELAISTLPRGDQDETSFVLANVNRWRGQLGLSAIGPAELVDETQQLTLDGATATLVSMVGKLKPSGMGPAHAPFSGAGNHGK
jgi:hypothetical protein